MYMGPIQNKNHLIALRKNIHIHYETPISQSYVLKEASRWMSGEERFPFEGKKPPEPETGAGV